MLTAILVTATSNHLWALRKTQGRWGAKSIYLKLQSNHLWPRSTSQGRWSYQTSISYRCNLRNGHWWCV